LPALEAVLTLAIMTSTATNDTLTIDVGDFQERCFELLEAMDTRRLVRIVITHRDRTVAEITPPWGEPPRLWGAHRGSVTVLPGVDLTESVLDEPLDAELGILHR
jgi:hypothetical protein